MYRISALLKTALVILMVLTVALQQEGAGPRCLSCTNVKDPAACRTVKECWPGESCFSEELLTANGTRIFNFGCKKNQECSRSKRFITNDIVVHVCHRCCLGDLCNLNACFNTTDLACYSCPEKTDPRDCFGIQLCADNEDRHLVVVDGLVWLRDSSNDAVGSTSFWYYTLGGAAWSLLSVFFFEWHIEAGCSVCYAETVIGAGARPYHALGCASTSFCNLIPSKRNEHLCQRCCFTQGCNLNICPEQ